MTKKSVTVTATVPVSTPPAAPAKAKPTTSSAKLMSSLAKTSTKVTKKTSNVPKTGKKKNKSMKYYIDCTHPVEDGIFDIAAFVSFQSIVFNVDTHTHILTYTISISVYAYCMISFSRLSGTIFP
jgi:hypothetical protein